MLHSCQEKENKMDWYCYILMNQNITKTLYIMKNIKVSNIIDIIQ